MIDGEKQAGLASFLLKRLRRRGGAALPAALQGRDAAFWRRWIDDQIPALPAPLEFPAFDPFRGRPAALWRGSSQGVPHAGGYAVGGAHATPHPVFAFPYAGDVGGGADKLIQAYKPGWRQRYFGDFGVESGHVGRTLGQVRRSVRGDAWGAGHQTYETLVTPKNRFIGNYLMRAADQPPLQIPAAATAARLRPVPDTPEWREALRVTMAPRGTPAPPQTKIVPDQRPPVPPLVPPAAVRAGVGLGAVGAGGAAVVGGVNALRDRTAPPQPPPPPVKAGALNVERWRRLGRAAARLETVVARRR